MPTTTPPAPVHSAGFTTSQLMPTGFLPFEEKEDARITEPSLSKIARSSRAALISVYRAAARSPQRKREQTTANSIGLNGSG
jgi:hypothetical protein